MINTLGLPEIAAERFRASRAKVPEPAGELPLEPDLLTPTLSLGRDIQPDELITARREARNGRPARLYDIYDEMTRFGPGAQIAKLRRALISATPSFLPPEAYRDPTDISVDAKLAREIAEAVAVQFRPHIGRALKAYAAKYTHGVVGLHLVLEARGAAGQRQGVVRIETIKPRRLELDQNTQEWQYRPFANRVDSIPVAPFIETGQLVIFEDDEHETSLDQRGLLFQCLIVWALANLGLKWFARFASRYGMPVTIAQYDTLTDADRKTVADGLKNLGPSGYALLPKSVEVKLLEALKGGAGDVHQRLTALADETYDRVFLGHSQASNVQQGAGSKTSADEAGEQAHELNQSRADEAATDFTEDVLRPYVVRNWGRPDLSPVLTLTIPQRTDAEAKSRVVVNLANAGAGARIDVDDVIRQCGLKVTEDPEKGLVPKAVAPQQQLATAFAAQPVPGGLGEEIVGPIRDVIARAARDGISLDQVLARLRHRVTAPDIAPKLQGELGAALLGSLMRGIESVREVRN